jgi:hypothetical protein
MAMIAAVFANMLLYLTSVATLWAQNNWKEYLVAMVINWILFSVVLVFSLLVLGLIVLHLYLIYKGLTTFEYIMNKRNAQIAPTPMHTFTNTHLNEPSELS